MTTLSPRPDFDWSRLKWHEPHSDAMIRCSYCDDWLFADDDDFIPLMMWKPDGTAASFCAACMAEWWGFNPRREEQA